MEVADEILLGDGDEEMGNGDEISLDNVDHQVLTAAASLVTLQQQQELRELVHT